MTTFIDSIYEFYQNPQNLAAFEEWKERKRNGNDAAIKSKTQKTDKSQKVWA
jgi:hypothetical protein